MILLLLSFNSHILIYTGDLVEKLHTGALSRLPRQKRGRRLWRKAQKQPKPDSCSLSHPHAASPKARQGSALRRRIFPDICAQNTCESGVMNQVLLSKITRWSCFLCLAEASCTPYTLPLASPSPCRLDAVKIRLQERTCTDGERSQGTVWGWWRARGTWRSRWLRSSCSASSTTCPSETAGGTWCSWNQNLHPARQQSWVFWDGCFTVVS